jgi:predicted PurR-regulated permease PerM
MQSPVLKPIVVAIVLKIIVQPIVTGIRHRVSMNVTVVRCPVIVLVLEIVVVAVMEIVRAKTVPR